MKFIPIFFMITGVTGLGMVLWGSIHNLNIGGWRSWVPFYGIRYRTRESTKVGIAGLIIFVLSMLCLERTYHLL